MSAPETQQAPTSPAPYSPGVVRYVVLLLMVVYTLNFIDRQIVNILAESIKRDLHLLDWQIGAMTGLGFALFYTVLGIPMARLAERYHRGWILSGSLFVWSGFTALSSAAMGFGHLMAARIGVGIGEAACTPVAQSLITDITPKEKRSSALATFSLGIPIGSLLGLVMGGVVAEHFGWRAAFLVAGVPGVLLAVVAFFTLPEPRRRIAAAVVAAQVVSKPAAPSLWETVSDLRRKPAFWGLAIGAAFISMVGYGQQAFYASFFLRNYSEQFEAMGHSLGFGGALAFLGISLGLVLGVAGGLGTLAGGRLGDRWAAKGEGGYARVAAISALFMGPILAAIFLLPSGIMILALLPLPMFLKSMWFGPVFAALQSIVNERSRATSVAIFLFVVNLIGLGLGSVVLGAISDALRPALGSGGAIRWAMIIMSLATLPAAFAFWQASRVMGRVKVSAGGE